ncbi:MAG: hypothetical protein ACHQVS_03925 [Candidatus Babeliales bacterium]
MKCKTIALLVAGIQLFQPLTSQAMHTDNPYKTLAHLGFIGTSLGVLGSFLGLRYYQSQQAGKQAADEVRDQLPGDVRGIIGSFLVGDAPLAHDEKLQFLPAILPINKKTVDTALQKTIDANKKRIAALRSELEALHDLLEGLQTKYTEPVAIPLYAHVLSSRIDRNTREIDLADIQRKNIHAQLFIKDQTPLHTILGEPLFPGEVAFIGYSDGSVDIELTDADTQIIKNLSEKERTMLRTFYVPRIDHGMTVYQKTLTRREWSAFQRVFNDEKKRTCVNRYYNFQVEGGQHIPRWKAAMFGAVGIAMYLGGIAIITNFRWRIKMHRKYPDFYKMPSCTWLDVPILEIYKLLSGTYQK